MDPSLCESREISHSNPPPAVLQQDLETMGMVSILSPCYNVSAYLPRYFSCLIAQTYKHLEIILVNDGSTDNTGALIEEWTPKLEAEGYVVKVLTQSNQGLCGAINNGLKLFTGSYLTWPDPDDTLDPDAIEKRVAFLKAHPQYGGVRSEARLFIADKNKYSGTLFRGLSKGTLESGFIFEDILTRKIIPFPVAFLVRSDAFLEVNPEREIFVSRIAGQNFQMVQPVAYQYPFGFIPEPDCTYYQYPNSHSRLPKTVAERNKMADAGAECVLETLKRIPADFAVTSQKFLTAMADHRFRIAFRKKSCPDAFAPFGQLWRSKALTREHFLKLSLLLLLYPFLFWRKR